MNTSVRLAAGFPQPLAEELIKRVAYVSAGIRNPRLSSDRCELMFDLIPTFEPQLESISAAVQDIAAKLTRDNRVLTFRTVATRETLPGSFASDPHPILEAAGELIPLGTGRYAFGPRLVSLMAVFERRIGRLAQALSAPSFSFPSLIGADVLDRCQYFRNFPTALTFVTHLREDHASIREFATSARVVDGHLAIDPASVSGVDCLLAPSVCFHWYACLAGKTLLPTTVTAVGKCFRYESSNLTGLERLWDFTMREVIFAGTVDYVRGQRQACIDESIRILDDLALAYEITTATDPFFADAYAAQAAYQQGFELKFELLAPLPYSGRKLAVGSINYHQDFFGRSFDITADGAPAHTGCIGFGLERLALAFVAQHGLDERTWPEWVANR
jgi:seryl-tRNA synthetase